MKGFLEMFEMLDYNINHQFWAVAKTTLHQIEGAIFYAVEMDMISREQLAELKELVEYRRNLIP